MDSHSENWHGCRVHFIGAGGVGMSALAGMLLDEGAIVTGSEPNPNDATRHLQHRGARISLDQTGTLLSPQTQLVVRTAAVTDANREWCRARELGLQGVKYAQLLGRVMDRRLGIGICGTHGKSTTTSMVAYALTECGADPSFVVGGVVPQLHGASHYGRGQAFVVEACEYDRSFHSLRPRIAAITNIEADHVDYYRGGIDEIIQSFRQFVAGLPKDGLIIANGCDANVARAVRGLSAPIQWVGSDAVISDELAIDGEQARALQRKMEDGRWKMEDGGDSPPSILHPSSSDLDPPPNGWHSKVTAIKHGCYSADVLRDGETVAQLELSVAGAHNLWNATMALAVCTACGTDPVCAAEAIGHFVGVERRMSYIGSFNGAKVVDDYGHHPTEIRTTLKALREKYSPRRLLCVFQPHQASRTRLLLEDFGRSFAWADETILPDIYSVRDSEEDRRSVSAMDLVDRIIKSGRRARHLPQFDQIVDYLRREARPQDLVVTMGAGTVWQIAHRLVK